MSMLLKTSKGKDLVKAIKNQNPISFLYNGPRNVVLSGKRIYAEPVALGMSKTGNFLVRAYIEPPTKSKSGYEKGGEPHNWRTFMVSRMKNIRIDTRKKFPLGRPQYNGGGDDLIFSKTLYSL